MKILHITPQLEPELGGIATFAARLLEGLAARGHEQRVITAHGRLPLGDAGEYQGVALDRVPLFEALETRSPALLLRCRTRAAAVKRQFAPEIIHVHIGGPVAFLHLATSQESPAPLVVTVHDLPEDLASSASLLTLLDSASALTANSMIRRGEIARALPNTDARLQCIHPMLPDRREADGNGDRAAAPLLMTGGRLVPEKGFDTALDAMVLILRRHPRATLVITGDGDQREALARRIDTLGLAGAVTLAGRLDDDRLAALRRQAWITLVPSLSESFGLVALEAMQAGAVVVASRTGGLPEVVADGDTGVLVPPGDAAAMADAVNALIDDDDTRTRLRLAAQARARAHFPFERFIDAYQSLFARASGRGTRHP